MATFTGVRHRLAIALGMIIVLLAVFAPPATAQFITVNNPVIRQRADTAVYKHTDGYYYMTASVPDYKRVELRRATTLQGLGSAATAARLLEPQHRRREFAPQRAHSTPIVELENSRGQAIAIVNQQVAIVF